MLSTINEFYRFLDLKHKRYLFFQFFFSFFQGLFEVFSITLIVPIFGILFNPSLISENAILNFFYHYFNFKSDNDFNFFLLIIFIVFFSFSIIFGFISTIFSRYFSNIIASDIGNRLFNYYLKMDLNFHKKFYKTDLIKKIVEEVRRLPSALITPIFVIISKIIVCSIIFLLLLLINFNSTLIIFFMITIIYFLIFTGVKKLLSNNDEKLSIAALKKIIYLEEGITSYKETKIYGLVTQLQNKFSKNNFIFFAYNAFNQIISDFPRFFIEIIIVLIFSFIGFRILLETQDNNILLYDNLILYLFAFFRLAPVIQSIYSSTTAIKGNLKCYEILRDDYISSFNKPIFKDEKFLKRNIVDTITFKNIFYETLSEDRKFNLNFDSFTLSKKDKILVHGKNGSGKTTFCEIIMGLLKPQTSEILLNSNLINYEDILSLNIFSYAPQKGYVFNETLLFNITLHNSIENIDSNKLNKIINLLNLKNLLENFNNDLNYVLKEDGNDLSMGQRQKIILARALYNSKEIIVFDEPRNFLEESTSSKVVEDILKFLSDKIVIVISHEKTDQKLFTKKIEIENGFIKNLI